MADTITCRNCGTEIQLSEALTGRLREQFTRDFAEKQRTLEQSITAQQQQLDAQRTTLEQAQRDLAAQVAQKLAVERKKLSEQAQQQVRESVAAEMQDLRMQLAERAQKLEETQRHELALRTQQREVEERARNMDLELTRKLAEARTQIQEDARKQAAEDYLLQIADQKKLVSDLQTQIETLKQRAEQGSQQSQGEVMELQLEDMLKQAFPLDEILPVPQGTRGADLLQHVHNQLGQKCGVIIWESKRTKNWSQPWLTKLKDDARAQGADLAILVSQTLPEGITHSAPMEGVWVSGFSFALPIATALRNGLLQVASARRAESGKGEKMEVLYQFVTSPQFRRQVEGVLEAFVEMKRDLDGERRAMERLWKKREAQLARVLHGTSGQYGALQGIVGSAALPEIPALELDGSDPTGDEGQPASRASA